MTANAEPRFNARRAARLNFIAVQQLAVRELRTLLATLTARHGGDPLATSARILKLSEQLAKAEADHVAAKEELSMFDKTNPETESHV